MIWGSFVAEGLLNPGKPLETLFVVKFTIFVNLRPRMPMTGHFSKKLPNHYKWRLTINQMNTEPFKANIPLLIRLLTMTHQMGKLSEIA